MSSVRTAHLNLHLWGTYLKKYLSVWNASRVSKEGKLPFGAPSRRHRLPQARAKGKKVGGKSRHVTLAACQEGRCQHFTTSNYASHEEETPKVSKVQTDYLLEGKDP